MAQQIEHIKWINGTNFMVDGFNFQSPKCKNYFLTHFHSDHTTGLNRSFSSGVVFCSPITATLLIKDMGMPAERVIPLPVDEPHVIDGITVTLMDANHCPGACMMLFKVPVKGSKPQMILHTGDMRWQPRLADHPALKACKVDVLYMDTTYCSPKHVFPSQDNAIASLVRVMREAYAEERKTLFVVGSYHIGKERAFLGAAKALDFKIWCHQAKKKVMEWCEMPPADLRRIVTKESAAQIHVVFMGQGLQPEALEQRRLKGDYAKVVAFRPTGWSFQKKGLQTRREGNVTIYGIPYSEHSSFAELRNCVKLLKPKRLIPTVNCPDAASARAIVDRFADLMDLSHDKSRLDCYFGRTASAPACSLAASSLSAEPGKHDQDFKVESDCLLASPQLSAELLQSPSQSHSGSAHDDDSKDAVAGIINSSGDGLQADLFQGQQHWPTVKLENGQAGSRSSDQVKKEDSQAMCAPGWADDDHFAGNSPLPVRSRAGPQYAMPSQQGRAGPSHAYSAPAALEHDTAVELDDGHQTDFLSQPVTPASCQRPACSSAGLHESVDPQAKIDACCGEVQQQLSHRPCTALGNARDTEHIQKPGCGQQSVQQTIRDTPQPVMVANDTPVCLLDDIDVAEQTRILSQIHQEALHARQCLPTKKRQLTLGCFVGPKRVK